MFTVKQRILLADSHSDIENGDRVVLEPFGAELTEESVFVAGPQIDNTDFRGLAGNRVGDSGDGILELLNPDSHGTIFLVNVSADLT